MTDLSHQYGSDLSLSASGDVLLAPTPAAVTQERVLRRLLTAPLGYHWHPRYGAGLPGMVGQPASAQRIRGIIQRQMRRERGVGATPTPSVDVTVQPTGLVTATVRYADQAGTSQTITVTP